jgi:hypothetical protein
MKEVVVLTWILYCFLDHLCLPKLRNLFSLRHGCKDELTTNPSMTHPTTRAGCRLHSIGFAPWAMQPHGSQAQVDGSGPSRSRM